MVLSSRRKGFVITSASENIGTSGWEAAILDLPHPVWLVEQNLHDNPIRLLDLENVTSALDSSFLSNLEAEMKLFPV